MLVIAAAAVIAFGAGLTLCIDWGGATSPPHLYAQPGAIALRFLP